MERIADEKKDRGSYLLGDIQRKHTHKKKKQKIFRKYFLKLINYIRIVLYNSLHNSEAQN